MTFRRTLTQQPLQPLQPPRTEAPPAGHSHGMHAAGALPAVGGELRTASDRPLDVARPPLDVARVFEQHFDFVWRSARRLGVQPAHLDDVSQEVFVIVHRRAADFEGRSALRTWLFGITRRVVRDHFRGQRRKPAELVAEHPGSDPNAVDAEAALGAREAQALLHALLLTLDQDKREVFVLAELEQMSMPEIALALDLNLNTAYARLRAARAAFEQALRRHRARQGACVP